MNKRDKKGTRVGGRVKEGKSWREGVGGREGKGTVRGWRDGEKVKALREAHPRINSIIDYINKDNLSGFQLLFCQTVHLQFETELFDIETEVCIDMEVLVDFCVLLI